MLCAKIAVKLPKLLIKVIYTVHLKESIIYGSK